MRIAYVASLPEYSIGIANRIKDRASAAKDLGLNFDFYYMNPSINFISDNVFFVKKSYSNNKLVNKVLFKINTFRNIIDVIPVEDYDFIVLRYPLADSYFGDFLEKYGHKTITEHHTKEVAELLSTGRFVDKIRALNEKLFSSQFLKKVKGIIGVTEEIALEELKKSGKKPFTIVSNGININKTPFTKFENFNGKVLNLIFVASYFYPWHGLDIVLKELHSYKGNIKINLNLIGKIAEKDIDFIKKINSTKDNVRINPFGILKGKKLDDIFAISTIAISTIAISTKKMTQACPLKTREYIARGIPFVYGYDDVDLRGDEKFALKLKDGSFDIYKVIEFAYKVSNIKNLSRDMRNFAVEYLDWRAKIEKVYKFASRLEQDRVRKT